jgi:hypothetical protein
MSLVLKLDRAKVWFVLLWEARNLQSGLPWLTDHVQAYEAAFELSLQSRTFLGPGLCI